MNRICLLADNVNRMREQGRYALLRLVGDEPSIYEDCGEVAVCEPYRMQGDKVLFLADTDLDKQLQIRQIWFAPNRMNPAIARFHLVVSDIQLLWFSELTPEHAMLIGMCKPEEVEDANLHDEIMGKLHSWWDYNNARIGRGVSTNPRVEFVGFRLPSRLIPAQNKVEVVDAIP